MPATETQTLAGFVLLGVVFVLAGMLLILLRRRVASFYRKIYRLWRVKPHLAEAFATSAGIVQGLVCIAIGMYFLALAAYRAVR